MRTNKFSFFIALCALIFASCVNDIPYKAEDSLPKLYMNALLLPDSLLTVTVGRTVHFLEPQNSYPISDAEVTAVVNGELIALTYDCATKSYSSDYILQLGDEVTLIVQTPTYGSAMATERVATPSVLSIAGITIQPFANPGDPVSLATLNDVDSAMMISLHIDDPIEVTNYYRLTIDYRATYPARYPEDILYGDEANSSENGYLVTEEEFHPHYLLTESSSRLVIDSESASQFLGGLLYLTSNNSIIFSDKQLHHNGKPIVDLLMLIELPRNSNNMYNPESGWDGDKDWNNDFIFPSDTVSQATYHYRFELETLSENYYHYLTTVSTYESIGNAFISEPVAIHSNVSTGIGIVGSYCGIAFEDSITMKF